MASLEKALINAALDVVLWVEDKLWQVVVWLAKKGAAL